MANRLEHSTSPYLLQHKDNPVDWFPWGEEAFEKAKSENKPIFLSIGYSSCHWCHVMEHESFENEEIAASLNESFVSVKVDREELPDVDEAFMTAVQLSSGRGGWPMTVFLTPDRKPFFAGTYFPPKDRGEYPGFSTIVTQIAKGWGSKRSEFTKAANEFSKALAESVGRDAPKTFTKLGPELIQNGVAVLSREFDREHAGFGGAPKFPPHSGLSFLIEYAASPSSPDEPARTALTMALLTLEAMAMGGIHDHVGGGFHRYSTDPEWQLPHFEKMLYDNTLLLGNYAKAIACTIEAEPEAAAFFGEVAVGIVEWLDREMLAPNGLYGSALDADSEGEEGKFYVWSSQELKDILGASADAFMQAYSVRPEGNFHDEAAGALTGLNVLYATDSQDADFEPSLTLLLEARQKRVRPACDDKQIICWNALLADSFVVLGEIDRAKAMLVAILEAESAHGRLPRQILAGRPSGDAYLEDHAALVLALADVAIALEITEDDTAVRWWAQAEKHLAVMIELFYDDGEGGFFGTSDTHEFLFGRTKPMFDQPVPSGNALAIQALLKLADETRARKSLEFFVGWMEAAPHATEGLLLAAQRYLEGLEDQEPAAEIEKVVSAAAVAPSLKEVAVTLAYKEIEAGADGKGHGSVKIQIPDGQHINSSEPPARWLVPTKVEITPLVARIRYPEAANDAYTGELEIAFTVELPDRESGADFEITVGFQACTDKECFAPKEQRFSAVVFRR